jgi:SAM-dependent methyltransferase
MAMPAGAGESIDECGDYRRIAHSPAGEQTVEIPVVSHVVAEPSPWVVRWAQEIRSRGRVLDLACGAGRHAVFLAEQGHWVLAVDLDCSRLPVRENIEPLQVDLEGPDWPLAGRQFDAVVVTNYLYRPHFDALLALVAPGGLLIYETFAQGHPVSLRNGWLTTLMCWGSRKASFNRLGLR